MVASPRQALSLTPRKSPRGAAADAALPQRTRLFGVWEASSTGVAHSHLAFTGRTVSGDSSRTLPSREFLSELSDASIISTSSNPGRYMPGTSASSHMGVQVSRGTSGHRQTWLNWWEDGVRYTEKFKDVCKRKYVNLTRAWRLLLDPPGIGRVSFVHFCKAARDMGFANVAVLWKHLDQNSSGFITLDGWDPVSYRALMEFRQICIGEFGGTVEAFKFGMDKNGSGTVTKDELKQFTASFDFQGDFHVLWDALDGDRGGFITVDELEFLSTWQGERFRPAVIEKQYNLGLARLKLNQQRRRDEHRRLQQGRERQEDERLWLEAQRTARRSKPRQSESFVSGEVAQLLASHTKSTGLPADVTAKREGDAEEQVDGYVGTRGGEADVLALGEDIQGLEAQGFWDEEYGLKEDDGAKTLREIRPTFTTASDG